MGRLVLLLITIICSASLPAQAQYTGYSYDSAFYLGASGIPDMKTGRRETPSTVQ